MVRIAAILEQTQWDFFWIPPDAAVVDRPELLYVRCPRDIPHLNTVTRLRVEGAALPGAIAEVCAGHAGVRSRFMVVSHVPDPGLVPALERAGYAAGDEHLACAVAVGEYGRAAPGDVVTHAVTDAARLRDWHRVAAAAFGEPRESSEADVPRELAECVGPGARVHRVVAYDRATGEPLSAGGLTRFPGLRFGLLWAGGTVPHARGRGAYTAVVGARVEHARRAGLDHVGLYARVGTSAPIVLRQGFTANGEMRFWVRAAA